MFIRRLAAISLLLLLLAGCLPLMESPDLNSTRTVFFSAVQETVTARALQDGGSGDVLATIYAQATDLSGESTARAAEQTAASQATATAILPVLQELPKYGVDPNDGRVAWLHRPVTIEVNGYMEFGYANDHPEVTVNDFVIASDITWNTQYASSGCGFMLRSNGSKESPSQLMVVMTRMANGTLVFSALLDGDIANTNNYYIRPKDKTFQWLNDTTNRLVVVARGKRLQYYTNGVLVAETDISQPPPTSVTMPTYPQLPQNPSLEELQEYRRQVEQYAEVTARMQDELLLAQRNYTQKKVAALTDGFVGFLVVSESGRSTCTFSNSWLYLIDTMPTPTPNRTWTATPTPTVTPTPRFYFTPRGSHTVTPTERPGPEDTDVPPTDIPPTDIPPTDIPPTDIPPTDIPPTDIPPTDIPPTEIPPTDIPPTEGTTG
jgi:hypothetical protein